MACCWWFQLWELLHLVNFRQWFTIYEVILYLLLLWCWWCQLLIYIILLKCQLLVYYIIGVFVVLAVGLLTVLLVLLSLLACSGRFFWFLAGSLRCLWYLTVVFIADFYSSFKLLYYFKLNAVALFQSIAIF